MKKRFKVIYAIVLGVIMLTASVFASGCGCGGSDNSPNSAIEKTKTDMLNAKSYTMTFEYSEEDPTELRAVAIKRDGDKYYEEYTKNGRVSKVYYDTENSENGVKYFSYKLVEYGSDFIKREISAENYELNTNDSRVDGMAMLSTVLAQSNIKWVKGEDGSTFEYGESYAGYGGYKISIKIENGYMTSMRYVETDPEGKYEWEAIHISDIGTTQITLPEPLFTE